LKSLAADFSLIFCPEPRRRAAIEDPPVIGKIFSQLGLPTRAPPRAPAQRFDLFQTICEPKPGCQRKPTAPLALSSSGRRDLQHCVRRRPPCAAQANPSSAAGYELRYLL